MSEDEAKKARRRETQARYVENNREKIYKSNALWQQANSQRLTAYRREYRHKKTERVVKDCKGCSNKVPLERGKALYCSDLCQRTTRAIRDAERTVRRRKSRKCKVCKTPIQSRHGKSIYCLGPCKRLARNLRWKAHQNGMPIRKPVARKVFIPVPQKIHVAPSMRRLQANLF